ncbi:FmdB family zinc ribbon protein [Microtetraspora sp. NBRC 13810]|uniref:FmdB family zinc ribbon protein n=1 Tax=Microtetraspora sp. NBRC 13810 TaxID=3030990 RepID=UPI0025531FAF|nr:FmdB family zinc ribbon protein [Microtetraspora sp. NBRC 13810]
MPTYQYACTACAEQFEVVQKFTDDALTECPSCSGSLRKVFSAVGIVFKGSGFYRTDNRSSTSTTAAGKSSSTESKSTSESKPAADSGSGGGAAKSEPSKPAAASTTS